MKIVQVSSTASMWPVTILEIPRRKAQIITTMKSQIAKIGIAA